jgi:acyl-CoA thioesterase
MAAHEEPAVVAPDAEALARSSAEALEAGDAVARDLGIEIRDVGPGRATAVLRLAPQMLNGHGTAHGGYLFLLADTAFAFACNTHGEPAVARACEIEFLRPGRAGDELHAVATERVRSGRSGIYDVTVRTAEGVVIAEFRGHSRVVGAGALPQA